MRKKILLLTIFCILLVNLVGCNNSSNNNTIINNTNTISTNYNSENTVTYLEGYYESDLLGEANIKYKHYLCFDQDGTVLYVKSNATRSQLKTWFHKDYNGSGLVLKGKYTIRGNKIIFDLYHDDYGTITYQRSNRW